MNAFTAIEQGLGRIGYLRSAIRHGYSFADVLSPQGETRQVRLAAFTQTPESFRSAAFGVIDEDVDERATRAAVTSRRALGAPLFLSVGRDSIGVWRANAQGEPALLERVPYNELEGLFSRNADRWSPQALHRAKSLSPSQIQFQYDFIDLGLMPAIEQEVQTKLHVVLDDVVHILLGDSSESGTERAAFRATFRLLAAKILRDREHPEASGWDESDVRSVLSGIESYYNLQSMGANSYVVSVEKLTQAWERLRRAVSLRNISADSLAYVYENTLVTNDTRKLFGTHSTPRQVADFIVDRIDLSRFDLTSLRIHEPFSGAGPFLVSALRRLQDLLPTDWSAEDRHRYLVDRISGSEIDGFACEVATLSLILADYPNANGWKIADRDLFGEGVLADALVGATVVLCNPPFEDFTTVERSAYKAVSRSSAHSKPRFALKTILDSRPAAIGLVVPHGFLRHSKYASLREELGSSYERVELVSLPEGIFGNAEFRTALVIASGLRRSMGSSGIRVTSVEVGDADRQRFLTTGEVSSIRAATRFAPTDRLWIGELDDLWQSLKDHPRLGDSVSVSRGLQWLPGHQSVSAHPEEGFRVGVARQKGNLHAFRFTPTTVWLNFNPKAVMFPGPAQQQWHLPKVLANTKRRSRGRWLFYAAADHEGYTASQQYFGIWPQHPDVDLNVLVALLNGPIANAFLKEHITDQDITNELLRALPVPENMDSAKISLLVEEYLSLLTQKTDAREAVVDSALARLLREIDDAVLDAYGLNEELKGQLADYFAKETRPVGHPTTGWTVGPAHSKRIEQRRSRALSRGREIAARDLALVGEVLTARDVAAKVGVTLEMVKSLANQGRILSLPTDGGALFPVFQFVDGGPLRGIKEVMEAFPDHNPWALANFLVHPNARLSGQRPLDALLRGDVKAATDAAASFGEQLAS